MSCINKIRFSIIKWKQYKHNYLHIRIINHLQFKQKKSEIEVYLAVLSNIELNQFINDIL